DWEETNWEEQAGWEDFPDIPDEIWNRDVDDEEDGR
ncbi:MAG: hypothetical protein H6Q61_1200, partial [Firmicutes bacterium]|nr:hypothetical protein [Bacillota bacterium]